jgi:23S rRNA pseudoU1915 N3-methylase RlmH
MRLRFIWTGKTRDARLRSLIEDYLKRLGHFVRCEITELRETVGSDPQSGIRGIQSASQTRCTAAQ